MDSPIIGRAITTCSSTITGTIVPTAPAVTPVHRCCLPWGVNVLGLRRTAVEILSRKPRFPINETLCLL